MKNIDKISESGKSRRYWRAEAKEMESIKDIKTESFNLACRILRNGIRRGDAHDWKVVVGTLLKLAQ